MLSVILRPTPNVLKEKKVIVVDVIYAIQRQGHNLYSFAGGITKTWKNWSTAPLGDTTYSIGMESVILFCFRTTHNYTVLNVGPNHYFGANVKYFELFAIVGWHGQEKIGERLKPRLLLAIAHFKGKCVSLSRYVGRPFSPLNLSLTQ